MDSSGAVVDSLQMTAAAAEAPRSARRAILWGWLLCGVLDITSAIIISIAYDSTPIRMLQGIAGAVLGPQTYDLGFATATMGLAMHFLVALTATAIYYWLICLVLSFGQHRLETRLGRFVAK